MMRVYAIDADAISMPRRAATPCHALIALFYADVDDAVFTLLGITRGRHC